MLFRMGMLGRFGGIGNPLQPTLDLNFASSLPSVATFTRASTATDGFYTDASGSSFNSFGIDVPRFINSGIYIEENRTNVLLNSGAPVTQTTGSLVGGGSIWSLWVIGTGSATATAGTAVGSGFGVPATAGVPSNFTITTTGTVVVTVTGSLNRFQLERCPGGTTPFPTSYIPTTGSIITRAVELCTIPAGPWYNSATSASTYFAEAVRPFFNGSAVTPATMYVGATRTGFNLRGSSISSNMSLIDTTSGAGLDLSATPPPNGVVFRAICTFRNGRQAGSLNGAAVVNSAAAGISVGLTTLGIGSFNSSAYFDGTIRRVKYWPIDLDDSYLPGLTA